MKRVHAANAAKLHKLRVIEHELVFDAKGWANADHLTDRELERLRDFHFVIETLPDPQEEVIRLMPDELIDDTDEQSSIELPDAEPSPVKKVVRSTTRKRGE